MKREVEVRTAFAAAYFSLSRTEQLKVERVINLLKYSPKTRPEPLSVFKSTRLPGHFIVRVTKDLRVIYHRAEPDRVVVKDMYRRTSKVGAL